MLQLLCCNEAQAPPYPSMISQLPLVHGPPAPTPQDFVGSNNINLLFPSGQFGTRLQGGKDAASPRQGMRAGQQCGSTGSMAWAPAGHCEWGCAAPAGWQTEGVASCPGG
jgi:hypothetical protein